MIKQKMLRHRNQQTICIEQWQKSGECVEGELELTMPGIFPGDSHFSNGGCYNIHLWGPNINDARTSSKRGSQFSKEKQLEHLFLQAVI
jgi:hypothetical protein